MNFYESIMDCEKKGYGATADQRINELVVNYFNDKYAMSAHTAIVLICTGEMPGVSRQYQKQLQRDIERDIEMKLPVSFINTSISRAKLKYNVDLEIWPNMQMRSRKCLEPDKKKRRSSLCRGVCLQCYSAFTIDIKKHPANLCICLDCGPNGVSHGAYSTWTKNHVNSGNKFKSQQKTEGAF